MPPICRWIHKDHKMGQDSDEVLGHMVIQSKDLGHHFNLLRRPPLYAPPPGPARGGVRVSSSWACWPLSPGKDSGPLPSKAQCALGSHPRS